MKPTFDNGLRLILAALIMAPAIAAATLKKRYKTAIPVRVDPNVQPVLDHHTALLWHFDNGQVKDASSFSNPVHIVGKLSKAPGRFGDGVALDGNAGIMPGNGGVRGLKLETVEEEHRHLSASFWMRAAKAPAQPQCLFELEMIGNRSAVRLELAPDGRLTMTGEGVPKTQTVDAIAWGKWTHVAVAGHTILQANGVYPEEKGIALYLNGHLIAKAMTEPTYHFPLRGTLPLFALGCGLKKDAGFVGEIDEFRISSSNRKYYALLEQPWLTTVRSKQLKRVEGYFPPAEHVVFYETFDKLAPVEEMLTRSGVDIAALGGNDDELGGDDEMLGEGGLETGSLDAGEEAAKRMVVAVDGVQGGALQTAGHKTGIRFPLPEGVKIGPDGGALEFLFQPREWDNLTISSPDQDYPNAWLRLMTLYGRSADGEELPLVKIVTERVRKKAHMPFDLVPHQWTHVVATWGPGSVGKEPNLYFDGKWVPYDNRVRWARMVEPEVWKTHPPSFIAVGGSQRTDYDELRVYDAPMLRPEVENSVAHYHGGELQRIGGAVCKFKYQMVLGRMTVNLVSTRRKGPMPSSAVVRFHVKGQEAVESRIETFDKGAGDVTFQVGTLAEGAHKCDGELYDADGRSLGTFEAMFDRRPLPWLNNRIGFVDTPPPPFTPVAVKGEAIEVVERRYELAPNGFPKAVVVRGEQILAGPIAFAGQSAGKTLAFGVSKATTVTSSKPVAAIWSAEQSADGLTIATTATCEYDGMTRYELTLTPPKGGIALEHCRLDIPLKAEYASLIHALPTGGDFRHYELARALPAGKGVVWDSKTWSNKRAIMKRTLGNFVPMVWLGGPVRGFCWFADNDKGWLPTNEHPAITIRRDGQKVTLSLHFIPSEVRLDAPRTIVFGTLATPPKPLPEDYRLWNRGNNLKVGFVGGRLHSCDSFAPWEVPARKDHFDFWPKDYDWDFAKRASDRQRKSKHNKYVNGRALMLYHDRRYSPSGQDGRYFTWFANNYVSYSQSRIDCQVWYMNEWYGRDIMDGLYVDDVFPVPDFNVETGNAYVLPDGRVQPGNSYFGYRQYLKRIWNVMHSHGKRPIITIHMTSTLPIPYLSFASCIFDGEDQGRFVDSKTTFLDAWPITRLRTLNNPDRSGLVTFFMFKGLYATRGRNKAHWGHMVRRSLRSAWTMFLLHDLWGERLPYDEVQRQWCLGVLKAYDDDTVTFHPYWRNEGLVDVKWSSEKELSGDALPSAKFWKKAARAEVAAEPIRASIYHKPGAALLVVGNFVKVPVKGKIRIALDKLGLTPEQQGQLRVVDADEWPEAEGEDIEELVDQVKGKPIQVDVGALTEGDEQPLDLELESDERPKFQFKDGVIELEVPPHDFQILELIWSNADG